MKKKKILIGEDEKNISEMYHIAFTQAGHKVLCVKNGKEVVDKAKDFHPDILLLDINMPVKDGFSVLKDITEDPKTYKIFRQVPIIMLSNYSNPQDIDYCLAHGADEYLIKSDWDPSAIVRRVLKHLEEQ